MKAMHHWPVRVYYEDTDAGGIVYYANYLKFLERGRSEWLRELGVGQDKWLEQFIGFVVKRVQMDNRAPARFNELLDVQTQVAELKKASILFHQHIFNQNNQVLVSAQIQVACVDMQRMRPRAIPDEILGELSRVV